jgi:AraC-like DNA-binding protein
MGVSTILVRGIVEAVERAGVARGELLGRADIDPRRLEQADGRFAIEEFARLQARALELTGDEALGLHMAEQTSETAFDLIAHLLSHAPTMRESLELAVQFGALLMDGCQLTLRDTGPLMAVAYAFPRVSEASDRMHAEFVVAGLVRMARLFGGAQATPALVWFEHDRPACHREYARVFGGVEHFGQGATSIAFDRGLVDRPQLHQHPELFSMLRGEAERKLERVTQGLGLADRLRQYLIARPAANIPDMATAARELGMSDRSLRRRLAIEGTSYRQLVQETLEMSAGHMLRAPHRSIQETAVALGFADAAAFHRAFKRWTGMTPKQYRDTGGR